MTVVPFAQWAPDIAGLNSQVTADVLNVLCSAAGYIPAASIAPFTGALPDTPLGAFTARSLSGQVTIFAGTTDKLYKLNNTTLAWDDVSQTLTTYSASRWSFAQFGEYVIATNINDNPQSFHLGVDTEFSDVGGSPPRAEVVRTWGDFVVLLNLASNPNRVQWSGLADMNFWTPGSNSSDYQDFPDGGAIQGSNSATNPIIFMERAIFFGTFVPGSTQIFTFQKVHDKRGARSSKSIATRGAYSFYADEGGLFQIGTDGSLAPIGREKVDRTTFEAMSAPSIANILGVVDPFHSRAYFAIDTNSDDTYDRLLVYDWEVQRWSQIEISASIVFQAALPGYTLESLDALGYTLDTLPYSLDSKVWQASAPVLAAFDSDNKLGFFNGPAAEATLTTQESGDTTGRLTYIDGAGVMVDTNDVTVSVGTRMRRGESVSYSAEYSPTDASDRIDFRSEARYHTFRTKIARGASWTLAQGIDISAQPAGMR